MDDQLPFFMIDQTALSNCRFVHRLQNNRHYKKV